MKDLRNWQAAFTVTMLFLLPHLALRFSYLPLVGGIYALFIVGIFIFFMSKSVLNFFEELGINKNATLCLFLLLAVIFYGVAKGISAGNEVAIVIKAAYETVGPIILFFLILISRVSVKNLHSGIIKPVLLITFIDGLYTAYQYFFISNYKELWFYQPLIAMGQELHEWSFSSDGVIRGVGIFTSPLENIYLILFATYYFAIKAWNKSWKFGVPLFFCITTGYLTGVRTFFVALLIGVFTWVILKNRKTQSALTTFVVVPLTAIIGTYLVLILRRDSLDLSSLDRLIQLEEMTTALLKSPFGYGLGSVGMGKELSFDSANGVWLISYGVLGGTIILYLYFKLAKTLLAQFPYVTDAHEHDLLLTLILFSASLLFISQFQYALVTPGRWYFVFASALTINHLHHKKISFKR